MSDNMVIATIRVYYNPVSGYYSARLWEGNEVKEEVHGNIETISDWLFCMSLAFPDVAQTH